MDFKEEIVFVLNELKKFNLTRRDIEVELDYGPKSIDVQLSRGGNKRLLSILKLLLEVRTLRKSTSTKGDTLLVNDAEADYGQIFDPDRLKRMEQRNLELEEMVKEQRAIIDDLKYLANQGKAVPPAAAS